MKKEIYRLFAYTWKALSRGTKDAVQYYLSDWRNSIANLIVGVISGVASPIVLYRFGEMETMPNILLIGEVGVWAGIIGLLAAYFLAWLVNIICAPARLHHDLEIELEKTTWKGIGISENEFPAQSGFGVGINIHNGKPIPIRDLKVGIYEIRKGRTIISQQTRDLPWYMNVSDMWQRMFTVIPLFNAGEDGKVLIANWDDHSAYFETFQDNNAQKINLEIDEKYYGKIVIIGRLQELYVSYPVYVCELEYDGKKVHLKLYEERLIYDENERPKLFNQ
jgi:hypothetical protein